MPINKDNRVLNVLLCKQKGKRFANLFLRNGSYKIKCRSLPIAFILQYEICFCVVKSKDLMTTVSKITLYQVS